jgi:hypothetical protein
MSNSGKRVDPLPEEFASYEEAAAFWDTHDTTDYPDAFQSVEVEEVALRQRRYEVEIDEDVLHMLREQARQRALPLSRLASDLLRQQLLLTSTSSSS